MIDIKLFIDSNEEYENFKSSIMDVDFENTLAILTKDKISYEYYAEECNLYLYKSEIDDNGDYNTVDKSLAWYTASELPETLEEFLLKLLRLFL